MEAEWSQKATYVKQGDLCGGRDGVQGPREGAEEPCRPGVRASVVAPKGRNGLGAKGRRKVEV